MMHFQQLLDSLPIVAIFSAFALGALLVSEAGFRVGHWWQDRTPEEKEGPTAMIVGSLLGLLAFLLAVSMGMAADRFDTRRGLILAEANALGTTYLRAGYLPEPALRVHRPALRQGVVPGRILAGATAREGEESHDHGEGQGRDLMCKGTAWQSSDSARPWQLSVLTRRRLLASDGPA